MSTAELEQFLCSHPAAANSDDLQNILAPKVWDEKAYDRDRKAKQRASGREVFIPPPKNIELRRQCLQDPELLLTTYFRETYFEPFTEDRRDMLLSIWRAAQYGGDQAIAAPRGEGKTTLAIDGALCLMLAGLAFFPVIVAKNQDSSSDEIKALRERILGSEAFIEDFPEIGVPLRAVGPQTANARLQTVSGAFIGMFLGSKHFAFPKITQEQLPHWPDGVDSVACGQVMGAVGIDGRIRGFKYRSHRPTLAIIDDVEDKDSVRSDEQITKIATTIEEDIGGMGASAERVARVYLCTTLNRKCNAYVYTDRKQKPSWNGRRYRKMITPPRRMDLVQQYIELRQDRGEADPDARAAYRFWRDNKADIEDGCVVSNLYSYSRKVHADGEPLELSAIQAYYNRVADMGAKAVATEIDNDPPETVGPQSQGVTAEVVASRDSGLSRGQLPANTLKLTAAIDLGKYFCHWVVTAWWHGAGGVVVDYGFESVMGTDKQMDNESSEPMIYQALLNWRDKMLGKNYTDATGTIRYIDKVLIDSGTFTQAAYEFCRQSRGPFYPSKGQSPFHRKTKDTHDIKAGANIYAARQHNQDVWLYHLNTDYWKQFTHERFLTTTFDENNMLRRGSLSLYHSEKSGHRLYSQHIAAEQLMKEFISGKGEVIKWIPIHEDNHWLDATYMAAAAAEAMGIQLFSESEIVIEAKQKHAAKPKAPRQPRGQQRFKKRPGGWIPKRRHS